MRLEKDSKGVIRVARNDSSGRGGQFAETLKTPEKFDVTVLDTPVEVDEISGLSFHDYRDYDVLGEALTRDALAVVAFGAHQPFTKAHEAIADFGFKLAETRGADFIQFTTAAFGKTKKHILPVELKIRMIQESINLEPTVVQGPFQMMEFLALKGYSEAELILGEDRSGENVFTKAASEYGLVLNIVSIPRKENSISGTKTREHIASEDYEGYLKFVAGRVSSKTKTTVFEVMLRNM